VVLGCRSLSPWLDIFPDVGAFIQQKRDRRQMRAEQA
jgi:hypothetical protein